MSSNQHLDLNAQVQALLIPQLQTMQAYHVPDRSGLIMLDAMENPYIWPEQMIEEWLDCLRDCTVNRYPDAQAGQLKERLRAADGIASEQQIILGNGSDELIQLILMSIARPGATVLAPLPAFVMYEQVARSLGLEFVGVPLKAADFSLDMPAMRQAIEQHQPAVIFLAYPNNPTANLFERSALQEILQLAPGLVVSDEAYAPFADASLLSMQTDNPSLLVMRTVSKLGLAGLRLGYLIGHPSWVDEMDKLRLPYNINTLTQVTAEFALSRHAVFDQQSQAIKQDRGRLIATLGQLEGCEVFPSSANFVIFRLHRADASKVFADLLNAGILVKNISKAHSLVANCLRVTVGTPEQNGVFVAALEKILA